MMSSEDSDHDQFCEDSAMASVVQDFLCDLAYQYYSEKSAQAKRQTKRRVASTELCCAQAVPEGLPIWATK